MSRHGREHHRHAQPHHSHARDSELKEVQIEGLALLKIIKHCKESFPDLVTGQLLGLDVKSTLEITNCFPFPRPERNEEEDEEVDADGQEYQLEMMKCLRCVNVDINTVGWYQSTYLGSFLTEELIRTQFNYQESIRKCVVLVYDPLRTRQGKLSLRALRLTDAFMDVYRSGQFTSDSLSKNRFTFDGIFQEVPIRLHSSLLASALLTELESDSSLNCDFDRLDLSLNPFLEKNMEFLGECLDDLGQEQTRYQQYQRAYQRQLQKRSAGEDGAEDKLISEPSRLESLLITNQISNYCNQINQFAGQGVGKLFLLGGLHKPADQ